MIIAEAPARGDKFKALFTTAVWGYDYVDRFLNYSLRTQLSDGNLGAFDHNSLYLLITDARGAAQIVGSTAYQALAAKVSVECVTSNKLEKRKKAGKYSLLTSCQNYALSRSVDFDAIFFGYADALWADGSYRAAARHLERGNDAIFSFGYPVVERAFVRGVDDLPGQSGVESIAIPPRILAQLIYQHLHPMARANVWSDRPMPYCPSYLSWDVPGQGLLTQAFHMHPVAVRVLRHHPGFFLPFAGTLDEAFVSRLYESAGRIYVSQSSDEVCVCSLAGAPAKTYEMEPPRLMNVADAANFAERAAGLMHRRLFGRPIKLICADLAPEMWSSAIAAATEVVSEIQQRLLVPDDLLALEAPAAFSARLARRGKYRQAWLPSRLARSMLQALRKWGWVHQIRVLTSPLIGREWKLRIRNFLYSLGLLEPAYPTGSVLRSPLSRFFKWLRSLTSVVLGPRSRSLP